MVRTLCILLVAFLGLLLKPECVASQDYKDAIFVAMSYPYTPIWPFTQPIKFNRVNVNVNGSYAATLGRVYVSKPGVYWSSLSVGVMPRRWAVVRLYRNSGLYAATARNWEYGNNVDTVGRDVMINANADDTIWARQVFDADRFYSSEGLQTSLTLFRLTGLMRSPAMFSAIRETAFDATGNSTLVFPDVLVNTGSHYNARTGIFTAPKDGLYFISYSVGTGKSEFESVIRTNATILGTLQRHAYWDEETLSRAGMYSLHRGDPVYVSLLNSTKTKSTRSFSLTSFSGFLYDPVHGHQVAWSVARTTGWSGNTALAPVPFEDVLVNQGGFWQKKSHTFNCPITGLYYVTVTAGAQPKKPVHLSVMVDLKPQIVLNRENTAHTYIDMLSRSGILFLKAGSTVAIGAAQNTAIHSTWLRHTSFTGFLIFPCNTPIKKKKVPTATLR